LSDSSPWFHFVVAVLATWRLARLLVREDGPFDLVVKLRMRAGSGFSGQLMDCPYCLGLWIAAPFAAALADSVAAWIAVWLAVSGGAAFLENLLERLPGSSH
jgi:hypothetical protein